MSEAHDTDTSADSEELILDPEPSEDRERPDGEDDAAEEDEGGEDRRQAAQRREGARDPLAPEELQRRYDNTRTALSEERRARRDLERRLEALERGGGRSDERQRSRAEPDEEIDPDVDPIGAMKQLRAKVAAYERQAAHEDETAQERERRETAMSNVEMALREHEADFAEDHPDYDAAAAHYAKSRAQELLSFGTPQAQIVSQLREEFVVLAHRAMGARKNPAALIYEMAKGRGYKPGAVDLGEGRGKDGGKGQTRLKDIARGARATSALQAGGGRSSGGVDAETISRINIRSPAGRAQFEREFAKMENEARRGGGR